MLRDQRDAARRGRIKTSSFPVVGSELGILVRVQWHRPVPNVLSARALLLCVVPPSTSACGSPAARPMRLGTPERDRVVDRPPEDVFSIE